MYMNGSRSATRADFFAAAFQNSPDLISVSSLGDGRFVEVNAAFLSAVGLERSQVLGKTSAELGIWVESFPREKLLQSLAKSGQVKELEVPFRAEGGVIRYYSLSGGILDIDGDPCLSIVARDVTERRAIEEDLRKSRLLLERAEEMARIGSWEFDYATREVTGSPGAHRIYGFGEGSFSVELLESVPLPEYRPVLDKARDEHIQSGKEYDVEVKIRRRSDGEIRDIRSKAAWDPKKHKLFGILRDITDEKRTEAELRKTLDEKETLLRELYHRTKNNMQVVSSLLDLEAASAGDERLTRIVSDMKGRIMSMALVHRMLYESEDLSRIDLAAFIPSLADPILSGHRSDRERIELRYDLVPVTVTMDVAIPFGLALNELVTNSMKHAFPGGRRGRVDIRLQQEGSLVRIGVADDGVGLPAAFDIDECPSLGMQLVKSLCAQLKGSLSIGPPPGCSIGLSFETGLYEARV
jgi:PAS domain S-box-containing protein